MKALQHWSNFVPLNIAITGALITSAKEVMWCHAFIRSVSL